MKLLLIVAALLTLIFIGCKDPDNYSIDVQSVPTATPMPVNMG